METGAGPVCWKVFYRSELLTRKESPEGWGVDLWLVGGIGAHSPGALAVLRSRCLREPMLSVPKRNIRELHSSLDILWILGGEAGS